MFSTGLQELFKALANENRQRLLLEVFTQGQEVTVNQAAEKVGLGQSTTSEHLAFLKRAGMLTSRRKGKEVYYRPDRNRILALLDELKICLTSCCITE